MPMSWTFALYEHPLTTFPSQPALERDLRQQGVVPDTTTCNTLIVAHVQAYGTIETFYGGLELLIGAPLMYTESDELKSVATPITGSADDAKTLLGQMELEHCYSPDSEVPFPSQTGEEIVKPRAQWAFVTKPAAAGYHLNTECAKTVTPSS